MKYETRRNHRLASRASRNKYPKTQRNKAPTERIRELRRRHRELTFTRLRLIIEPEDPCDQKGHHRCRTRDSGVGRDHRGPVHPKSDCQPAQVTKVDNKTPVSSSRGRGGSLFTLQTPQIKAYVGPGALRPRNPYQHTGVSPPRAHRRREGAILKD